MISRRDMLGATGAAAAALALPHVKWPVLWAPPSIGASGGIG